MQTSILKNADSKVVKAFLDGNGYAYNVILNLITDAKCYAEAMLQMKGEN